MYGRCETDPFDQATDVCDSCYGEFCAACMVKTKGRKHPICKECTIVASGVRPGAKPLLRGSKKTAAKRRKALKQAPQASPAFEYFDDAQPVTDQAPDTRPEDETTDDGTAAEAEPAADGADATMLPGWQVIDGSLDEGCEDGTPAETAAATGTATTGDDVVSGADTTAPPAGMGVKMAVTPGLAALAEHQAAKKGASAEVDIESIPAPDWLTEPVEGADPFADAPARPSDTSQPGEAGEPSQPTRATGRTPIDASAKPVTEGFDWVTELPERGSSSPLPTRSADAGSDIAAGDGQPADEPAGAVATADRPAPLPRRRSTLRSPDDRQR